VGVGSTVGAGFDSSVGFVVGTFSANGEGVSGVEESAGAAVLEEVGGGEDGVEGSAGVEVDFFAHGTV